MGHWRLNYGDLNLCIYKFKPKNIIYLENMYFKNYELMK